jgi:hypothetical protein
MGEKTLLCSNSCSRNCITKLVYRRTTSFDQNSKSLGRLRFVPEAPAMNLRDWVLQLHVGVSRWQALSKCVQEFLQDHGGSGKASNDVSIHRCRASFALAAESQRVTEMRSQQQQRQVRRPRVEIAALKKYLFGVLQIVLGREHAKRQGNLCLLS